MKKFVFRREEIPSSEIKQKEIELHIMRDLPRRVSFLQRKNIMQDNLLGIVNSQLRMMFSEESYQDMKNYIDVSNNLAKRVLKEISAVYKDSPQRTVKPVTSGGRYSELSNCETGFDINQKLSRANYLLNGLNDIVFQVGYIGDFLELHTYTPDMITVINNPDNPGVMDAILIEDYYFDDQGKRISQWVFWSPTRHFIVDKNYQIRSVAGNDEMLNPFRDINIATGLFYPFLDVHASTRENSFWDCHTGNDLFEGTKIIALQNTFRNFMVPMQFKQIAVQVTGVSDGLKPTKSNQIKSPLHVFESNGQIQVLDWQSNIIQLGESIQNSMFGIAGNYGISQENFKLSYQAASGFARVVAKERLNELRMEQVKVWRNVETQIFDLVRMVNNFYGQAPISETAEFKIDFAESGTLQDPKDELEILKTKLDMGILSMLDVVKQFNPDIETDAEAEEYLKKNIQIRNALKSRYNLDSSFLNTNQGVQNGNGNEGQSGGRFAVA